MNTKETLKQIKIVLGMEKAEEVSVVIEQTFEDAKLMDGTEVTYDKLEVGGMVKVKTDVETEVTAPAGEYELEDGTKVTVDETGTITEVKVPEVVVEEPMAEPIIEEPVIEEPKVDVEERLKKCEEKLAMLEEALNLMVGKYSKMKSDFSAQSEKLVELSNAPAAEPVHLSKETSHKELTIAEKRIEAITRLQKK
jgi:hypothetical protein